MKPGKKRKIIQERINELNKEYQRVRDLNKSAWGSYGSELCTAEMENKERLILKEIEALKQLLAMPEIDMDNKVLEQKEKQASEKIRTIESKEKKLSVQKQEIRNYIFLIKSIQELK